MKSVSNCIRVIVIYRTPPSKNNTLSESTFFSEFSTLLEDLVSDSGNFLLAGDFNFHVNDSSNTSAKKFLSLIIYTEMILDCDWSISVQLIPNRSAKSVTRVQNL